MAKRTLVIVNPRSRGGATARRWPRVEAKLRAALGPLEVERTRGPRDAERLAREAVRAGIELVIVAGGDGTLSEAASGLLGAGLGHYAELAVLPFGTGGDFARGLELPGDVDAAIDRIAHGGVRSLDAGRVSFRDRSDQPRTTYFVNIASMGLSGLVTELVNRMPKALGGRVSFFAGTLHAIARWRSVPVLLRIDGEQVHDGPLHLAAVANGCYFGGGMRVAPEASPGDGVFDVVWIRGSGKARLLSRFPLIYSGRHLGIPEVSLRRGARVEAEPGAGAEVWIEIDGEPLGRLPATFEVLPAALQLRGAEA